MKQGHPIQAHIPPLSNCKDSREEPSSLHNSKHTKHTHATRVQTQHFAVTEPGSDWPGGEGGSSPPGPLLN